MQEFIEQELSVPGASVFIGKSQWVKPETWTCPDGRYVVCQRLSERHAALQLQTGAREVREVYQHVHDLGFMPRRGSITMRPLGEPLRTLNCWFDQDTFEAETGIDQSGWADRAGEFLTVANSNLETMMRRVRLELEKPTFGSRQVIEAASTMILVEMARIGRAGRAEAGSISGLAPWQIRRVRERLANAVETSYPDIQELAVLCGVSRSHFMRMFKASTGQTAHTFIASSRLAAAHDLLRQDSRSIKEIAALLGFSSPGHFTHAFRREKHMTPSEFRRFARADMTAAH